MSALRLDRTILRLSGPDARPFLDNLITQNLERLTNKPVYGGLLSPQGKAQADFFIWPQADDGLLLEADPARGADLFRRLSMFKLRAAVTIDDESAAYAVVAGFDDTPEGAAADPRLAALGWRKIVPAAEAEAIVRDDMRYAAHRIACGVPDLAIDAAAEEVFALEALFEELNGVDFKKGCFVGQENVSRMKRRATTRKKFCPIAFEGAAPAPMTPITAGGVEFGSVRSGIDGFAIALLRLDRVTEALAQGKTLDAGGKLVTLAPPSWLLMPAKEDA
ncbi:MAG: folate-binding protein [Caulobacterales bacterium]